MSYRYNTASSEELKQGAFDFKISDSFHYIKVGGATVSQLKGAGILPNKNYTGLTSNKPDGLILQDKNNVSVLIEYKKSGHIHSAAKALELIYDWYFRLAEKVKCKIICISDGDRTYWFHSKTKSEIINEDGSIFTYTFDLSKLTEGKLSSEDKNLLSTVTEKLLCVDENGVLRNEVVLNPQNLANSVWQKIWISTGKEPEKCLYNVVEIFIFKFLSDLGILEDDSSFSSLYEFAKKDKEKALKRYATQIRPEIRDMFPKGSDQTTIINGTIFVNESGEPNLSQSSLFYAVLTQFYEYSEKYGSFKNIDKSFKTRLYESFLRQSAGISALGQYFTPRNVVLAIIKMANGELLPDNAIIGDPFCGVGGFLLEFINENERFKKQFEPINGVINPSFTLLGYDKGTDEKEDQRTIILAKANMLIYLSDLLVKHKKETKLFAENVFNKVFHLVKTNLGTFGIDEPNKFDLIITNPPYVTSGVSTIKEQIKEKGLTGIYPSNGNGLEGLALSWIIYSLKESGSAYIILPDGIMNRTADQKLRDQIVKSCKINAIISLPTRTFFATPKQTYILCITKKKLHEGSQNTPVFTYLISEIGETRDSKRFPIGENDLIDMAISYRQFKATPKEYVHLNKRCKIQPIERFTKDGHWMIDREWSDEERKELGIGEEITEISEEDFIEKINDIRTLLSKFYNKVK